MSTASELRPPLILFATGSTGGHVTPALAVGEAVMAAGRDVRIAFVGPTGSIAERMVRAFGGEFIPLDVHPLRGAGHAPWLRGLVRLPVGSARSLRTLLAARPSVVVGTGAHTSGPLVALASLTGTPTLIFEANVEAGLANLLLGKMVRRAAVAWDHTLDTFGDRAMVTGWPVRRAVYAPTREPSAHGEFRLLVVGGSGGAPELDLALREALPRLAALRPGISVVHQAAAELVEPLRAAYRDAGISARVEPFFLDMIPLYARASLVVTRAGAATLSELAAFGLPSVVVPLRAAGEHQRRNAQAWEHAGCGCTVLPDELVGPHLADAILALAQDHPRREAMGAAARSWHRPGAATQIAEWCLNAISRP